MDMKLRNPCCGALFILGCLPLVTIVTLVFGFGKYFLLRSSLLAYLLQYFLRCTISLDVVTNKQVGDTTTFSMLCMIIIQCRRQCHE